MTEGKTPIKLDDSSLKQILVAVFAVILTLVVFALYKLRKASRRHAVLITGLCDSGKTLIFSQLLHNKFVSTFTSIKENVGEYSAKNSSSLKIVDIPGHERLRSRFFDQYKTVARGVVFVVDSVNIQKDVRDAAEYLYNILTDPNLLNSSTSFLILCNKQDLSFAKGANAVKSILEKELNTLRITKASQLESVDPKDRKTLGLGNNNGEIDFDLLNVEIAECNAFSKDNDDVNIDGLKEWLLKIA